MNLKFKHLLNEGIGLLALNYFIGFGEILYFKDKINKEILGIIIIITIVSFTIINITIGHLNPLIGLTNSVIKKESLKNFLKLFSAQWIGSILGELLLKYSIHPDLGYTKYLNNSTNLNVVYKIINETVISILMLFLIIMVTIKKKENKNFIGVIHGFIIGMFSIILKEKIIINPSRYIGIAWINFNFSYILVYFVFPLLGAFLFSLILKILFFKKAKKD